MPRCISPWGTSTRGSPESERREQSEYNTLPRRRYARRSGGASEVEVYKDVGTPLFMSFVTGSPRDGGRSPYALE